MIPLSRHHAPNLIWMVMGVRVLRNKKRRISVFGKEVDGGEILRKLLYDYLTLDKLLHFWTRIKPVLFLSILSFFKVFFSLRNTLHNVFVRKILWNEGYPWSFNLFATKNNQISTGGMFYSIEAGCRMSCFIARRRAWSLS